MINIEYLQSKIEQKFAGKVAEFAKAIGASRQAAYDWLSKRTGVDETRIFDIAMALELTEEETETLLGVPQTILCFRKKGLDSVDTDVEKRCRDLANTFFKIDEASYSLKDSFLTDVQAEDPLKVAKLIRQNLKIDSDVPVTLTVLLTELKQHNINIFFIPFRRIGLTVTTSNKREVAFTARKGERIIIFVDTDRTKDQVVFDVCHELAHILSGHDNPDQDDERLCNKTAQELVYPRKFIQDNQLDFELLTNAKKFTWSQSDEKFHQFSRDFDWSAGGLAFALKDYGYIKKDSLELKRLMTLDKSKSSQRKTFDELFFANFEPSNYASMVRFFDLDIQKDRDIFKPMTELKDAAIFDRLSSRKLAEILAGDSGDIDELIRSWRIEITESQEDEHVAAAAVK